MRPRSLITHYHARRDDIGDLVTRRPLPGPGIDQLDPFLFLNHHGPQNYPPHNDGLPFGPHPHRGFETVTFILEGDLAHLDTGGHESVIKAGGVQWMIAGSGLIHAEISPDTFKREGGPLEMLQLWINLPRRLKMTPPRYTGLQRDALPTVRTSDGGADVTVISGVFQHGDTRISGPIASLTGVQALVMSLKAGATLTVPAPKDKQVFLYTVSGQVDVAGATLPEHHLARIDNDGDALLLHATEAPTRLLCCLADPIGEPVVSHGPFVMNTREEIHQAIRDYQAGLFGHGLEHLG
ncbi:redox-sensitive bicupin YhaK (pirin superfamily) [Robbsia andropogonis]|uniref:pirin family protein n=1 Tax=Robbsia andropogonis TaxID=28092 RepID=UPI003D216434